MSSRVAISVENICKSYAVYQQAHDRLKQAILPRVQRLFRLQERQYYTSFEALKPISFTVQKGETVGIIGKNGSGKSTLLQIICGTLAASAGRVDVSGRIAPLLELGSGFNPEFTGQENVYLNAAILGLDEEEIKQRFGAIADFADIGDFMYQPVRLYSSGMVVRLAFAVAVNSQPEILVVDEALSVGDEFFQRKCFSRIEEIRAKGATILFVSHSGAQIVELCDRAILLDAGEHVTTGRPKAVISQYQQLTHADSSQRQVVRSQIQAAIAAASGEQSTSSLANENALIEQCEVCYDTSLESNCSVSYPSQGAHIEEVKILDSLGRQVNCLQRGRAYQYTYNVRFVHEAYKVRFGMLIKTPSGLELGGAVSAPSMSKALAYIPANAIAKVVFHFVCHLNPRLYFMNAGVKAWVAGEERFLHRVLDICAFRVMPVEQDIATAVVDLQCQSDVTIQRIT